jgi:hypothetical protein
MERQVNKTYTDYFITTLGKLYKIHHG